MKLDQPRRFLIQRISETDTDLATVSRALGKNHAYLQQYIRNGKPRLLPETVREALGRHFEVSPDRFRGSQDEPATVDTEKRDLLKIAGSYYSKLPVFDLRLSAGAGTWTHDGPNEPLSWELFRNQWLRSMTNASPESLIIARVDGDSMEPTLRSGDQVLIDRSRTMAGRDGIYAIRRSDELQVKRVSVDPRTGELTIISDNPAYPAYPGIDPDSVCFIGRVIWLGRSL